MTKLGKLIAVLYFAGFSALSAEESWLKFSITGENHAGSYGGELTRESTINFRKIGPQTMIHIKLIHEFSRETNHILTGNLMLPDFKSGKEIDLDGVVLEAGASSIGVIREDDRFFTINSANGSGQIVIFRESSQQKIHGSFTIAEGDSELKGTFQFLL